MKSRYFSIFAVAALVGLAACETEPADDAVVEETNVEATAPVAEPVVVEPAPVVVPDTSVGAAAEQPAAPVVTPPAETPQP